MINEVVVGRAEGSCDGLPAGGSVDKTSFVFFWFFGGTVV
jgi:hypothetical protein